ncbi:MAG: ribose transport system permease protein [Solirubrobacteraceae bacterium]
MTRLARALSFRNVSALYVGVGFVVLFSIWIPDTFWTATTWKTLISEQAIVGIAAVGLVVPLAAGAYDLSIGMAVGLGSMIVAWLIGDHGTPMVLAIVASVAAGCAVGVINGAMVTRFNIDSFIATLAMTSVLTAVVTAISGGEQIIGLPESFSNIASNEILGIALPVYMMLAIALAVWYVLEHTPPGRRTYATGGNAEAARLTGVRTRLIVVVALIVGSGVAAFAGVLVTARSAASSPDVGAGYLLPAFAAAFLGSTQIRNGQFNVWGTILAVYVLAIGVKGLQLAGAPIWLPDLFNGVALAIAVGLARWRRRPRPAARARRSGRARRDRQPSSV